MMTLLCFGQAPRRVVSLAPNLTEMVCALDACDRLVGVTAHCIFPESVKALPKVGGYINPDLETILRLNPDLVLAVPEHRDTVERLRHLGLRVETIRNFDLDDIHTGIESLGNLLEIPEQAGALLKRLREEAASVPQMEKRPSCLLVLGHDGGEPRLVEVYAVARAGFLNDLLLLSGGENALETDRPFYPRLDREALISLNPEVIIELVPAHDMDEKARAKRKAFWGSVPHLQAVQNNHHFLIVGDHVLLAGTRYPLTLRRMREIMAGL